MKYKFEICFAACPCNSFVPLVGVTSYFGNHWSKERNNTSILVANLLVIVPGNWSKITFKINFKSIASQTLDFVVCGHWFSFFQYLYLCLIWKFMNCSYSEKWFTNTLICGGCDAVDLCCTFTSKSPLVIQASSTRNWRSSTFLLNKKTS